MVYIVDFFGWWLTHNCPFLSVSYYPAVSPAGRTGCSNKQHSNIILLKYLEIGGKDLVNRHHANHLVNIGGINPLFSCIFVLGGWYCGYFVGLWRGCYRGMANPGRWAKPWFSSSFRLMSGVPFIFGKLIDLSKWRGLGEQRFIRILDIFCLI